MPRLAPLMVSVALFCIALSGCVATEDGSGDGDPQDPGSDEAAGGATDGPATNSTDASDAPAENTSAADPFFADVEPWSSARFEVSGAAGEWVVIVHPFASARSELDFEGSVRVDASGGAIASYGAEAAILRDNGEVDVIFPDAFMDVSDEAVSIRAENPGTSGSCGGCAFFAVYTVIAGTEPWSAVVRFASDDLTGGEVRTPAYLERGNGTMVTDWQLPADDPASTGGQVDERFATPAGFAALLMRIDAGDGTASGEVEVAFPDYSWDWEFYEGLPLVADRWAIASLADADGLTNVTFERTGLGQPVRFDHLVAPGAGEVLPLHLGHTRPNAS